MSSSQLEARSQPRHLKKGARLLKSVVSAPNYKRMVCMDAGVLRAAWRVGRGEHLEERLTRQDASQEARRQP